jgi:hypothetical protein
VHCWYAESRILGQMPAYHACHCSHATTTWSCRYSLVRAKFIMICADVVLSLPGHVKGLASKHDSPPQAIAERAALL